MKSEKRHELQKNELADWLGNHAEGASEYFWPVVGGIVAAFALAVGIAWYLNTRDQAASSAWDKYYQAHAEKERDAELAKVTKDFPDSAAALWAQLALADDNVAQAAKLMLVDTNEANPKIKEAEAAYKEVLSKARSPELITRAQYGMARTQETNCQPEEARKFYEEVAKTEKDSALGKAAAKAAARMADPKTVEFLAWFAKAERKKPVPTGHGGMPGSPPFQVPSDLPARPDISLPGPLNIDPGKLPESSGPQFPKPDEAPKPEFPKADAPKGDAPPAATPEPKKPGE
jgi:hypothetical protein